MKTFLLSLLLFTSLLSKAEEVNVLETKVHTFSNISATEIIHYLKNVYPDLQSDDINLQLTSQRKTNVAFHFTFIILYQQIPVLHSSIKVSTDKNGNLICIKKEHIDLSLLENYSLEKDLKTWAAARIDKYSQRYFPLPQKINSQILSVYHHASNPCIVLTLNSWNKYTDRTLILNAEGEILFEYDNTRHANIDTTVSVKTFNPDPLTTAGQTYSGIYVDNNDINSAWMNAQYSTQTVTATFDNSNNTFYLENEYVKIDDIESPNDIPASSATPSFLFDRSQSGFEDANAFYHITNFHHYISSLGYDTLMDLQLVVDAHAQFGADNSIFNRNGGNPQVMYGTGGVDDAEDADVIIHEYCHGISWSANDNSTFSFQRAGLDEGLADYFATSYSRSINPFNWENVFNWDGPVWGGRTANTTLNHPNSTSIYKVGEIWSTAMSKIWTDLGQVVTDKLMLESLHFYTNNTTLPEAALYVKKADTLLFGGIHTNTICNRFQEKNILAPNCFILSLDETEKLENIKVVNTLGFANNNSDAIIQFPSFRSGSYYLVDMTGRTMKKEVFSYTNNVSISGAGLQQGMYILHVETPEGERSFKLSKY